MKNIKKWSIALFLILFFPVFVFAEGLTVAAAANLEFAIKELKQEFEKETGLSIDVIIGSSGKLTAQIENGAPFDVFLSADMDYPKILAQEGLVFGDAEVYASGVLVLWTLSQDADLSKWQEAILKDGIKKIAIINPKTAPYGRQAVNALKYYKLYKDIYRKLVYGENISQASQFIATGAADIGFTAKSVVLAPEMKDQGVWVEIDPKAYQAIEQGAVVLKYGHEHHPAACEKFMKFLFSEAAREIFIKYGYLLP